MAAAEAAPAVTEPGPVAMEAEPPSLKETEGKKKGKREKAAPKQPAAEAGGGGAAAPATEETGGAEGAPAPEHVGRHIRVWWNSEKRFYNGKVTGFNAKRGKYFVEYEDGDKEWVNPEKRKFEWAEAGAEEPEEQPPAKRRRRAAARPMIVESEEEESESEGGASEGSVWGSGGESSEESGGDDSDFGESEEEEEEKPKKRAARPRAKPAARAPAKAPAASRAKPAAAAAKSVLSKAASTAAATAVTGPAAGGGGGERERFREREAERFPFLRPDKIRDAKGRRPDHEDYNPSTLQVPPRWLQEHKVSPGQTQWWGFKSQDFDAVCFFKMGKFYELFEMDAHIGQEHLGLAYMGGEQPHCGFPEKNFALNAERLARKGFKVIVVEQTETPDQLKERNEERRAQGLKRVPCVRREKVAVVSPGTMVERDMLCNSPEAAPVVSLAERVAPGGARTLGVCLVDVSTGRVTLGRLADDANCSRLRTLLSAARPAEVIYPRSSLPALGVDALSGDTLRMAKGSLRGPRLCALIPREHLLGAGDLREALLGRGYFGQGTDTLPAPIEALYAAGGSDAEGAQLALQALSGAVHFLQDALLDRAVFSFGLVEALPEDGAVAPAARAAGGGGGADRDAAVVKLDASAIENLEILENGEGALQGTLIAQLDHCATATGHRLLRKWVLQPLQTPEAIRRRQAAVRDLMGPAQEAMLEARNLLRGMPDLERSLSRLNHTGRGLGREAERVVLYEDMGRARLGAFLSTLRGFELTAKVVGCFEGALGDLESEYLKSLLLPGRRRPDLDPLLDYFRKAFDWGLAEREGSVAPRPGVDARHDAAGAEVAGCLARLDEYLEEQRQCVGAGGQKIAFVTHMRDRFQMEVPEAVAKRVPAEFQLTSQRKAAGKQPAVKRFTTEDLSALVKDLEVAEEEQQAAVANILRALMLRFLEDFDALQEAAACVSELDCLMSLATHADMAEGPMCVPEICEVEGGEAQVFEARALRHPAAVVGRCGSFVPNDIRLGGGAGDPAFTMLTGPNMGGKSTLLRQACLAAVLAQVGACVPAASLRLSPADAIYVRMGAKDCLSAGQSTFFVELMETASVLRHASPRSLVALDELGRGTSTSDGAAVAAAVVEHLVRRVRCRTLFSTHYHSLAEGLEGAGGVRTMHMACSVGQPDESGLQEVTFLYKLTGGSCPESYGVNVAQLAGIPRPILVSAMRHAASLLGAPRPADEAQLEEVRRAMRAVEAGDLEELRAAQRDAQAQLAR